MNMWHKSWIYYLYCSVAGDRTDLTAVVSKVHTIHTVHTLHTVHTVYTMVSKILIGHSSLTKTANIWK